MSKYFVTYTFQCPNDPGEEIFKNYFIVISSSEVNKVSGRINVLQWALKVSKDFVSQLLRCPDNLDQDLRKMYDIIIL